jgi:tetratricopeptide (TPR) repeat protein
MADLSFEQRAFDKSKLMYERYLALAPDDLGARARLASALTFLKSYDAAISELEKVLAKDPRNFPAKAYYAITMSEKGDKLAALRIGREALAIAPSEEARRRFGAFLASIAGEHPPITGQPLAGGRDSTEPKAQEPGTKNLEEFLRTHPIVAPKIISIDREASGAVLVVLKNFPIEQMPEGVRMKFFGSLEATMVREGAKELRLIDSDSQKTLATIRP